MCLTSSERPIRWNTFLFFFGNSVKCMLYGGLHTYSPSIVCLSRTPPWKVLYSGCCIAPSRHEHGESSTQQVSRCHCLHGDLFRSTVLVKPVITILYPVIKCACREIVVRCGWQYRLELLDASDKLYCLCAKHNSIRTSIHRNRGAIIPIGRLTYPDYRLRAHYANEPITSITRMLPLM
jgi:hypothetical protein